MSSFHHTLLKLDESRKRQIRVSLLKMLSVEGVLNIYPPNRPPNWPRNRFSAFSNNCRSIWKGGWTMISFEIRMGEISYFQGFWQ